jgi:hypothetical protein
MPSDSGKWGELIEKQHPDLGPESAGCGNDIEKAVTTAKPTQVATAPSPSTHLLAGSLSLEDFDGFLDRDNPTSPQDGDSCFGRGGYDDIVAGANVVVKDASGTIVATSQLGEGSVQTIGGRFYKCVFKFAVTVPDTAFYSIEISHRGALSYSKAELESKNWELSFKLGA